MIPSDNTCKRWVLLRGLARGNIHWGEFPKILSSKFPDLQLELLELAGNGFRFHESSPTDAVAAVESLRSQSQWVSSKQKFHICALSLGGMIALKWAELYPSEVASVTVVNSSLPFLSPFYYRLRPQSYCRLIKAALTKNNVEREQTTLKLTTNQDIVVTKYLKKFTDFSKLHPIAGSNFLNQLMLANNIYVNKTLLMTVHVIYSAKDHLVNPECSLAIAKYFQVAPVAHTSAGHDIALDDPEWLAQQIGIQ